MSKKAIIITLVLLLAIALGTCGKGESRLPSKKNIENKAHTAVPTVKITDSNNTQQKPDVKNGVEYKVTGLNYSKSDDELKYDIKYPQISELSDTDKQKKINNILKDEAIKVLNYYEDSYGSVELKIDYKAVLMNPYILSIQYSGVGSVSNAAHPNSLFYTTNINIKTGDRLKLKDIINVDMKFANKFLKGEFKALRPEQSEVLELLSAEDVQENFNEADSLDNISTEKQSDVFSYFTNDSFGISISVGHALGDHAEFEINYQDLKDNIKTENGIWKDLLQ